jgi:hypothetical protein
MKIICRRMTATRRADAQALLNAFLREDEHYLATSGSYGDGGLPALKRALGLFLRRPELGFVWLAYADNEPGRGLRGILRDFDVDRRAGCKTRRRLCRAASAWPRCRDADAGGAERRTAAPTGSAIDTSVVKGNTAAENYYRKNGFAMLGEERLTLLL